MARVARGLRLAASVAALVAFVLPAAGSASTTTFVGDYETGDYSQWGVIQYQTQLPLSNSFNVVQDPVRQGRYAGQFIVAQGYSPFGWNESTEVDKNPFADQGQGSDFYYTFSLLFPQDWVDPYGWALVEQFYTQDFNTFTGPPPLSIDAGNNHVGLNINAGLSQIASGSSVTGWENSHYYQLTPSLNLGQWNDFVLHVHWAADHTGVLEVWYRSGSNAFQQVLSLSGIPTLRYNPAYNGGAADPISIIKQGLYRESYCAVPVTLGCTSSMGVQPTSVLYQDAFTRSTTFADAVAEFGSTGGSVPANTAAPTVTGVAQQGQMLSASTGTWSGGPTSYSYQWQDCDTGGGSCADVSGANASTYALQPGDVGDTVRVAVTAANTTGSSTAPSSVTATVQGSGGPVPFGKSAIGASWDAIGVNYKDGRKATLTAPGTLSEIDAYQKGLGGSGSEQFRAVVYKADGSGGAPGTRVAVSNELTVNATDAAGWRHYTFPSSVQLAAGSYWLELLAGGSTVAAVAADRLASVEAYNPNTYSAGASDPYGTPSYSDSDYSIYGVIAAAAAPASTAAPAIAGTLTPGQTLTASTGTWSGSPTLYAYQWSDCDAGGANCATIGGATASTYTVRTADLAHTLVVAVTASNSTGSATVSSSPTVLVTDTVAPSTPGSLKATATDTTHVSLTWTASTDNVGVTGYRVYRGSTLLTTVTSPGYADSGLTGGTPYSYSVVAVDAAGNSSSPATAGATTPLADTTPPTAPSSLQASAKSGTVSLSWKASTDNVGVAGYRVLRDGAVITTVGATTLKYSDVGVAKGRHTYTVVAFDAAANASAPSNARTVNV